MPETPIDDLKKNALSAVAKPLVDALDSIIANPTVLNLAAQAVALQGNLLAAAPALETFGIKDAAQILKEQLNAVLTPAPAPAPTEMKY